MYNKYKKYCKLHKFTKRKLKIFFLIYKVRKKHFRIDKKIN